MFVCNGYEIFLGFQVLDIVPVPSQYGVRILGHARKVHQAFFQGPS